MDFADAAVNTFVYLMAIMNCKRNKTTCMWNEWRAHGGVSRSALPIDIFGQPQNAPQSKSKSMPIQSPLNDVASIFQLPSIAIPGASIFDLALPCPAPMTA
jgi:hypothetical protein